MRPDARQLADANEPNDRERTAPQTRRANSASRLGDRHGRQRGDGRALGDFFQYTIDHPVSLARQKRAMLPIVGKDVEGQKVSIYNQSVQTKHPLLGLKFKNTSGAHLNQGPITVFEGSVYAGDTRVLDVQPNEERLVSYAIDLGTEVDAAGRARHAEDHQREGGEGDRHHRDEGDGGEEVQGHQPLADRPHAADRAPEPDQPAVQAGRHRQADGGHAGGLPLPDAGEGGRDQDLHGEGGAGHLRERSQLTNNADDTDPLLHQPDRGQPGAEAEAARRR